MMMDRCHSIVGPMVSNQWKPLKNHHHQWLPHQKPLIPIVVFQLFIYWQIPPYLGYSLLKRVRQAVVRLTVPFIHPISVIQGQIKNGTIEKPPMAMVQR